jgi:hypothetical protein
MMISRRCLLVVSGMFFALHIAYGSLTVIPKGASMDTNYPGSDFRTFSTNSTIRCADACLADRRCLAWTWVKPPSDDKLGGCWLKTGSPTVVKDRCCISGVRPPTGAMENGVDRPGSDYKNFVPANAGACQNACNAERQCKSWTYVRPNTIQGPNAQCYLKNQLARPIANAACISGGKPAQ